MEKIGINDNFFELGGDSLSAIKLQIEGLKKNLKFTYADIFSAPTVKLLAQKAYNSKTEESTEENYDFAKIDQILQNNKRRNIPKKIVQSPIGNVLLTGSTGFLGAHILDAILSSNENSIVYCLIRQKNSIPPKERLKNTLNFYFGDKHSEIFEKRIRVIEVDITKTKFGLSENQLENLAQNVSIAINSAALVKHYGDYSEFNSINVVGTKNIIEFCEKYNKKLYHISTTSVSGQGLPENNIEKINDVIHFSEDDLYKKQNLNNTYVKTKFEAEKLILDEISKDKLKATIFRIGNLSNRYSDGKFQINAGENAFVNRIKCILKLGCLQKGFMEHSTEFSPVDLSAQAIVEIIKTNPNFTVFHIFNNKLISFINLVKYINNMGINLDFVSNKAFSNKVNTYLNDPDLKNEISGIITALDSKKLFNMNANILVDASFTAEYLKKLGFTWHEIDEIYIRKYINYFKDIHFFEF